MALMIQMATIGLFMMVANKLNVEIPNDIVKADIARLTNQLWKLIPMRENEEN